jgi:DNA mismatch repair protein MutS
MNPLNATPMIQQYLAAKHEYPDAILFYRMGDFYEMFFEDAELASRLLEITLTSRNKKAESPIPMCGVPHRAVQGYVARLLNLGHKVAICDQVENPAAAKGLVKREVVRIITPGMVLENELLDEKSNNYVLSIVAQARLAGLSFLDISTGGFKITESKKLADIIEEARRISPSEILLPKSSETTALYAQILSGLSHFPITFLEERAFDYTAARERLLTSFKTISLEGFGCENMKAGICAAGALLFYVRETQKQTVEHVHRIESYRLENYLIVDDVSHQNLEIEKNIRSNTTQGTLLGVIDKTVTAMGGRMLKQWTRYPLMDAREILARYQAVEEAKAQLSLVGAMRNALKNVYDIERLRAKISMGHASARDLLALKSSLQALPEIEKLLSSFQSPLFRLNDDVAPLYGLADLLEKAIREDAPPVIHEGGMIKTGFHEALDELIRISKDGKAWLADLECKEREETGITALKVRYNKVFGYYLEVPKTRLGDVPDHYIRKQTLANAERYITDALKSFEAKVLGAEERRAELEHELFNDIKSRVKGSNQLLQSLGIFLARLDCLSTFALVAEQHNYTKPEINAEGRIFIENGRHPVVEQMISGERFVPNSIQLDNDENQVLIITGPNMAGKSTVLRQVALLVIMAQMGAFVPAKHMDLSITDRIFTRVGALDNLSQGQSTFMVEMQETANILNHATQNSLVIMDEIGRGTSTFDGFSIAWAVAEFLHDLQGKGVKTLFATHYHELMELAEKKERVKNFNIAVKEWNEEIIFLRKLVQGGSNRSYGIQVARLAGIPDPVIAKAKKILAGIEKGENPLNPNIFHDTTSPGKRGNQVQLPLFHRPENRIIHNIRQLDLSRMTPMDALIYLNELQELTKQDP